MIHSLKRCNEQKQYLDAPGSANFLHFMNKLIERVIRKQARVPFGVQLKQITQVTNLLKKKHTHHNTIQRSGPKRHVKQTHQKQTEPVTTSKHQ